MVLWMVKRLYSNKVPVPATLETKHDKLTSDTQLKITVMTFVLFDIL